MRTSNKKSLAGLDNTTTEGSAAFDTLEEIVNTMGSLGNLINSYDKTTIFLFYEVFFECNNLMHFFC